MKMISVKHLNYFWLALILFCIAVVTSASLLISLNKIKSLSEKLPADSERIINSKFGRFGSDVTQFTEENGYYTQVFLNIKEIKTETKTLHSYRETVLRLNAVEKTYSLNIFPEEGYSLLLEGSYIDNLQRDSGYLIGGSIELIPESQLENSMLPDSLVFNISSVDPLVLKLESDVKASVAYPEKGSEFIYYWNE